MPDLLESGQTLTVSVKLQADVTMRSFSAGTRELWIAPNRHSRFQRANFFTSLPTKEFFIIDAADSQVSFEGVKGRTIVTS